MNGNIVEERLVYLSPEEFALLMELTGSTDYKLYFLESDLVNERLDSSRLTKAFGDLYKRGFIERTKTGFILGPNAKFISDIAHTTHIVHFESGNCKCAAVLLYVCRAMIWRIEVLCGNLAERYRIGMLKKNKLSKWLFESGILRQPRLTDEDMKFLCSSDTIEEAANSDAPDMLRITIYDSFGNQIAAYKVSDSAIGTILCHSDSGLCTEYYTQEALDRLLMICLCPEQLETNISAR